MDTHKVLIGGERSSGKTTLMNLLVSGKTSTPFPRGVRGRSSTLNTVQFSYAKSNELVGRKQTSIRISTSGTIPKIIDIQTPSPGCTEILLSAVRDISLSLLSIQPSEETTGLSLKIQADSQIPPGLMSEVCANALADFTGKNGFANQKAAYSIPLPRIYIHLTSAIKPLAHVERQAIIKFLSLDIPVIMLVNKCDLVCSETDFNEIFDLAHFFASNDCKKRLPYYMISLAVNDSPSEAVLGAKETRDLIRRALDLNLAVDV
jgi:hypothetical protein